MLTVAPPFPAVDTPAGWTREARGPRVWLLPPTPGGRIVVAPLQARPKNLPPQMFLDRILLQEADRFPRLKQTEPTTVTNRQNYPGLVVDVAVLDANDQVNEWRCYALFATSRAFGLVFLQAKPQRHAELRAIFFTVASGLVMPEAEPAEGPTLTTEEL